MKNNEIQVEESMTETELTQNVAEVAPEFDDEAEKIKEEQIKEAQIEADKELPPDPDAILEVRHLKKHFVLKKTLMGKPLATLKAVDRKSVV